MYPFKKVFDTLTVIVQQIDNVQRREGSRRDFETFFSNLTNSAQTFPLSFLPCFAINQALFLSFFLFSVQQSECLPEKRQATYLYIWRFMDVFILLYRKAKKEDC